MAYGCILVETRGPVGLITFNRPEALNAFNDQLMTELTQALQDFEADDAVGAMVVTGSEKAFAAGADIKEMQAKTFADAFTEGLVSRNWEQISRCRKPVIAAVAGYALGGGNEIAMMCDIIIASPTAKFGQPEVRIGTIPGAGGTQRLTRAVGKAKAMDMILTGRNMTAEEAETMGLVSRIVPTEDLLEEAVTLARTICGQSRPAVMLAKEAVNRAFETSLSEGVLFERRAFHATFSTEDQKEGMAAFSEKRSPRFQNR